MCTYLAKRGSTYYFRRLIPAALRPFMEGRAEFMISLRTKDRDEAKRLVPGETVRSQLLLDAAAQRLPTERPRLPRQAQRRGDAEQDATAWETRLAGTRADAEAVSAKEARRADLQDYIDFLSDRIRGSTAEMPPAIRAIAYMVRDAEFDRTVLQEHLEATRADMRTLERSVVPSPVEAPSQPTPTRAIMLDTDIIDLWAAERKVVPKGKDTHRAVARWFYDRVGIKPVAQITRKDVLAFKAALVTEGQTPANIKMKLSRLRTLLQWAADNDYADMNVATGITIKDTDAARNKRKEFDLVSLNAIFAGPVHSNGHRPAGGKGEAAYWLPLLALFTGARLEELGQLRPQDIEYIDYPDADGAERSSWFIRIKEDPSDKLRLKNADSERDVPVHPELHRLGFLKFVEAAKNASDARLFPKLAANVYGRLTAKWGEWFSPYLRSVCGVTDRRLVFHSFRHTFKQYARHAGIIEGVQRQIMGHSGANVADDYGSGYSRYQLVAGMSLYKVPGLVALSNRSPA